MTLIVAVFACVHGRQIKQNVKRIWSRWDVQRAAPLLQDESKVRTGTQILLRALQRTPDEPDVIRALAVLTDKAGMPAHSRFFYEHLARGNAMTPEDGLRRAAVLARLNDRSGAQIALQQFASGGNESPGLWRAQAEVASTQGDHASAQDALGKVLVSLPQDHAAAFDSGKAQAFSPAADRQQAGITQLLDLFEKTMRDYDPTLRLQCFWTLSSMTIADAAQRARFARLIDAMPWKILERRVMQRLLECSLDATGHGQARLHAWLRGTFAQEKSTGADERLSIAKMLQRHGEHALVLEWITHDIALRETGLCTARLDSLMMLKQWPQAAQLINHPAMPLPRALQAIMQAHLELLATGGRSSRCDVLLAGALAQARKQGAQGSFIAVARMAAEFGRHDTACIAYAEALNPRYPVAHFAVDAFIQEARLTGASAAVVLRQLLRRAESEAWNQDLLRQIRYYRVLCGQSVEVVEAEALAQRRDRPQDTYSAFLVAFARLRLGQTTELRSYLPLLTQPCAWTPGEHAALHAIFLAANDQAAAAAFKQGIPASTTLFPEEYRLCSSPNGR
ncbi:MAG: tetratricopeptide repeat protein [Prosthecobacter sp.]|uniref:tetratricopeptide repeat protein n=1 Tax=Prosthecobacter sp. TaxID=1965333 RepID=UPI003902C5A6